MNLILSKNEEDYLFEIDYHLDDFQKACLIWNQDFYPLQQKIVLLKELYDATHDKNLKNQIKERIKAINNQFDFEESHNVERFENSIKPVPYYVKQGNLVIDVLTNRFGILASSSDYNHMIPLKKIPLSNYYVSIYILSDRGYWISEQVNPLNLEYMSLNDIIIDEKKKQAYCRALESMFDWFMLKNKGRKPNDGFVIEMTKDYAKLCNMEKKCFEDIYDKARKVDDIIYEKEN